MTKEDIEGMYLSANFIVADSQDEKLEILANMLVIQLTMQNIFYDNPNLIDALNYMNYCYKTILDEADFEHAISNSIQEYIKKHEFILSDRKAREINAILEVFENLCDTRLYNAVLITNFYTELINGGILTNSNYYVRSLPERISLEEKEKMILCLGDKL